MPNSNIRLIIEKNIPFVKGLLDEYATVQYLAPEEITAKAVRDIDGLVIRTRTICNEELLRRSECKLIATATIGTDHIDLPYCASRSITAVNAPGCNAPAVAQYVIATLLQVINRPLQSYTVGIVGLGHVGSIVERWLRGLDVKVLRCDPPRMRAEGGDDWVDMDTIAREADVITVHTPLTMEGEDSTFHLLGDEFLGKVKRMPIIINTSRGAVADTRALIEASESGRIGPMIIDCWENEPDIDPELLRRAAVATPHIAGYSIEGKVRASQVVMDAVSTFFMLPRVTVDAELPPAPATGVSLAGVLASYNPMPESDALKAAPERFEELRNKYPLRHEAPEGRED